MATRTNRAMDQMVNHLIALDKLVAKGQRQQLMFGLQGIRNEEQSQVRRFSGNGVLSGVGRNGARVGTVIRVKNEGFGSVRATGPWQIRDSSVSGGPIKPHLITSRYGGGSRRGRARRIGGSGAVASGRAGTSSVGTGPPTGKGRGVGGAINIFGETSKQSEGWRLYARHPGSARRAYWVEGINRIVPSLGKAIANRWMTKNLEAIYK